MPEDFNSVSVVIKKMGLKGYVPSEESLTASYDTIHAGEDLDQREVFGLGRGPRGVGSNPALDKPLFLAEANELTLGVDVLQKRRRKGFVSCSNSSHFSFDMYITHNNDVGLVMASRSATGHRQRNQPWFTGQR